MEVLNRNLLAASDRGNLLEVERLVGEGADKETRNGDGWAPLHRASMCGHLPVIEFLVGEGAGE